MRNCRADVNIREFVTVKIYSYVEESDIFRYFRDAARVLLRNFPRLKQPNRQNRVAVYRRIGETGSLAPVTVD